MKNFEKIFAKCCNSASTLENVTHDAEKINSTNKNWTTTKLTAKLFRLGEFALTICHQLPRISLRASHTDPYQQGKVPSYLSGDTTAKRLLCNEGLLQTAYSLYK